LLATTCLAFGIGCDRTPAEAPASVHVTRGSAPPPAPAPTAKKADAIKSTKEGAAASNAKAASKGKTAGDGKAANKGKTADKGKAKAPKQAKKAKAASAAAARAKKVVPLPVIAWPPQNVSGRPPKSSPSLHAALAHVRQRASVGETRGLESNLSRRSVAAITTAGGDARLPPIAPRTLARRLTGKVVAVHYNGGRAVIKLLQAGGKKAAFFYLEQGAWRLDLTAPTAWRPANRGEAAPLNRPVSLREATSDIPGQGPLQAWFDTSAGTIRCQLHERRTPRTVAHFVGLARGIRGHLGADEPGQPARWQRRPFYDGLRFHRSVADRFIQTGDLSGTGAGHAGFTIADELDMDLRHDRVGVLSLASAGPNTGSSQLLITATAAPEYDDVHTVFGLCQNADVINRIASTPANSHLVRSVRFNRSR